MNFDSESIAAALVNIPCKTSTVSRVQRGRHRSRKPPFPIPSGSASVPPRSAPKSSGTQSTAENACA